jgi:hypothetical protein
MIGAGEGAGVLRTDDLFLGAFALARGGELVGVEVSGMNGRRVAYFRIEGAEVEKVQRDYYQGPALVNLQLLKAAVRRLKDEAFAAIRQEERKGHASTDQPGADRHDQVAGRPRGDRR